jgi:UDP-N-acetylmuramate dehydrogenase
VRLERHCPLRERNTLALPATARAMAVVSGVDEVKEALALARTEGLRVVPLGEGSNVVLVADVAALVLRQRPLAFEIMEAGADEGVIRSHAGQDWHELVAGTLASGYFGLENLALIPGTVGAAPIQNIGAYGVELSAFVDRVYAVAVETGEEVELARRECQFGYRDSVFKHRLRDQLVITAVDLRLPRRPAPNTSYPSLSGYLAERGVGQADPQQVFEAVVAIRSARLPDPARLPNAGSFFKNPVVPIEQARALVQRFPELPNYSQGNSTSKLSAAWMIDYCGFKGRRAGGAGIHSAHALVLVNHGDATGRDVLALAGEVEHAVATTFGVTLEIEPRIYGEVA